jgi:hypothetical protein
MWYSAVVRRPSSSSNCSECHLFRFALDDQESSDPKEVVECLTQTEP